MLGKLLKHEYIYILKSFTPIYIAYFAFAVGAKMLLTMLYNDNSLADSSGFMTLFWIIFVGFYIFTMILALMTITNNSRRFKKNMFSQEGYLTNTLPVKTTSHINAKLLAGATNYICSFVAIFIAWKLIITGIDEFEIAQKVISKGLQEAIEEHMDVVIAYFVFSTCAYIAFMLFCYMLSSITSMIGGKKAVGFVIGLILVIFAIMAMSFMSEVLSDSESTTVLYANAGFYAVSAVIEYAITASIIKNKLNLQ